MPQTPPEIQTVPPFMVTLSVQTDPLRIPHAVSPPASLPQKLLIRFRLKINIAFFLYESMGWNSPPQSPVASTWGWCIDWLSLHDSHFTTVNHSQPQVIAIVADNSSYSCGIVWWSMCAEWWCTNWILVWAYNGLFIPAHTDITRHVSQWQVPPQDDQAISASYYQDSYQDSQLPPRWLLQGWLTTKMATTKTAGYQTATATTDTTNTAYTTNQMRCEIVLLTHIIPETWELLLYMQILSDCGEAWEGHAAVTLDYILGHADRDEA